MTPLPTILVADDDRSIRTVLGQALGRAGYQVQLTPYASTLWQWVQEGEGDLVITDVAMPDGNGLELVTRIRQIRPDLRVIVMSAQSTLTTAVKATQRGAFEYLAKPFDLKELLAVVARALTTPVQAAEKPAPAQTPEERLPLIGQSVVMQGIYRSIARLTTSDLTVMITGESGTGKELVARALHEYGRRRNGPFIAVNMAAIPREQIESELFGYERGSNLGRMPGRFEQASGGTLFLDEIGDMPQEAQTRLLRVLQEGEFTTVGGSTPLHADVRIVAATHRDLRQAIQAGTFREDLYYRLNVVPLRLPPLRERREDIPLLARHFLAQCREAGGGYRMLDEEAMDRLQAWRWPGNVRELENLIRRIVALYSQETITADLVDVELADPMGSEFEPDRTPVAEPLVDSVSRHIARYLEAGREGMPLHDLHARIIAEVERPLIQMTLTETRGNQIKAAAMLGLNRNTLRKKIRDLEIPVVRGVI